MVRIKKYRSYKGEVGKVAPNLLERFQHLGAEREVGNGRHGVLSLRKTLSLTDTRSPFELPCELHYQRASGSVFGAEHGEASAVGSARRAEPILHSDQGWQYQHKQYQKLLKDHSIKQSMSRKSNCLDNAVIENFFGLVKSELLYMKEFDSMDQFKAELIPVP